MKAFAITTFCVFLIFHIIGYHLLIKPLSANSALWCKVLCVFLVVCNFLLIVVYVLLRRYEALPDVLAIIFSLAIFLALLVFFAGVLNIIFLIIFKNNLAYKILAARCLFGIVLCCFVYGIWAAHRMPKITTQEIKIEGIQKDFSILVMADLHSSKLISASKVKDIVELANSANADIIVLVGDIIDASESSIKDSLLALKELKAKHGVYFVLGNHEYIFGAQKSLDIIQNLGNIRTLVNENIAIDDTINLIGISDLSGFRVGVLEPDLEAATREICADLPSVLLSHQPNVIKMLQDSNVPHIDLVLSGHTHGGQIMPFSFFVYLANPFLYGLKTIDNTQLFITQGASLAVTYARLGTRQEINLLTLKAPQ